MSSPADIPPRNARPQAVLFACGLNSVRSRMAAGLFKQMFGHIYVGSAGVRKGDLDPFAIATLDEVGIDISKHRPMTFEELELTRTLAADVEYWPTQDPTAVEGSREQRLDAYRQVRDELMNRIRQRFGGQSAGNE